MFGNGQRREPQSPMKLPADMPGRPEPQRRETYAPQRSTDELRLVADVEGEIGEFVRKNRDNLARVALAEAIDNIDPNTPPAAAVDMANLLTSTFEAYAASLDQVRAATIEETARLCQEIDVTKVEIAAGKDVIANHHIAFMTKLRNHLVAVVDLRRTVAAQRAAIAAASTTAAEPPKAAEALAGEAAANAQD